MGAPLLTSASWARLRAWPGSSNFSGGVLDSNIILLTVLMGQAQMLPASAAPDGVGPAGGRRWS